MRHYIICLIVSVASCASLPAQTPEQVATNYFEKMKAGEMNTVSSLMHPDELRKFHQMLTPVIERGLASDRDNRLFQPFADPQDPTKMRAVDDSQFMSLFMEAVESVQPGINAILKSARVEALGHIRENDVIHVVVRMKLQSQGIEIERMSVLSLKDHQGVPKVMLSGEMKGVAEALKRRR
jgi:hypothetical protein